METYCHDFFSKGSISAEKFTWDKSMELISEAKSWFLQEFLLIHCNLKKIGMSFSSNFTEMNFEMP